MENTLEIRYLASMMRYWNYQLPIRYMLCVMDSHCPSLLIGIVSKFLILGVVVRHDILNVLLLLSLSYSINKYSGVCNCPAMEECCKWKKTYLILQ